MSARSHASRCSQLQSRAPCQRAAQPLHRCARTCTCIPEPGRICLDFTSLRVYTSRPSSLMLCMSPCNAIRHAWGAGSRGAFRAGGCRVDQVAEGFVRPRCGGPALHLGTGGPVLCQPALGGPASRVRSPLPHLWCLCVLETSVFVGLKPVTRRSIADNLSHVWSDIGPGAYGTLSFLKACIVVQCTVLRQGFSRKGTCRQRRLYADVCMDAWPCRSWGWLAWRGMRGAETAFKLASLLNFLAFLRFGKYRCATAPLPCWQTFPIWKVKSVSLQSKQCLPLIWHSQCLYRVMLHEGRAIRGLQLHRGPQRAVVDRSARPLHVRLPCNPVLLRANPLHGALL